MAFATWNNHRRQIWHCLVCGNICNLNPRGHWLHWILLVVQMHFFIQSLTSFWFCFNFRRFFLISCVWNGTVTWFYSYNLLRHLINPEMARIQRHSGMVHVPSVIPSETPFKDNPRVRCKHRCNSEGILIAILQRKKNILFLTGKA